MSRLPPFGRRLVELRASGVPVNVWIFAGARAWERARAKQSGTSAALVLPAGESPGAYAWPVADLDLVAVWPDGEREQLIDLGATLVRAGARLAILLGDAAPAGLWCKTP